MKIKFIALIAVSSFLWACNNQSQKNNQETKIKETKPAQNSKLKLQVYYFHATHRCLTCNSIEKNVKEVLNTHFKDKMDNGIINFISLNAEYKENQELAEKYQATGASLHFVQIDGDTEIDNNLTEYAFSYSRNQPDLFLKGIQDTISYFLNK